MCSNQADLHLTLTDPKNGPELPQRPSMTCMRLVCIETLRSLAHPCPCVLETRRLWAAILDPDREPIREVLVVPPHMGLTDPRAYVRLAAIVRQQIIDGKLRPGGPAPSITFLSRSTDMHGLPAVGLCAYWKTKGC